MNTTQQSDRLQLKIATLHGQQIRDWNAIESQYYTLKESITIGAIVQQGAVNYIKSITHNEHLFPNLLSLAGGYLSKKIVVGNSKNEAKKIVGYAVQFLTTQFLSNITNK